MGRAGENIHLRSDGLWEGRFIAGRKPDGKARYVFIYGKTVGEVREKLQRRLEEQLASAAAGDLTVGQLVKTWLSSRRGKVKEASYRRYQGITQLHILPDIGNLRADCLTADILSDYKSRLLRCGRADGRGGLSRKSVIDVFFVLRSALKLIGSEYMPLYAARIPAETNRSGDALSGRECEVLKKGVLSRPDICGAAYLLALGSGLTLGEICALRWEDFSPEGSSLTVRRAAERANNGGKTYLTVQEFNTQRQPRDVPVAPETLELLRKLRRSAPGDEYILTGKKNKPMEPRTLQYRFKAFLKENGIGSHSFSALRNTFAVNSTSNGTDLETLSRLLGHKNVKSTVRLYGREAGLRERAAK